MLNKLLPFLTIAGLLMSCGGDKSGTKKTTTLAAYKFEADKTWETESIPFPISFAPQIPYKGTEELRFAPGWEFTSSEEHWAYSFLWWLDGKVNIDSLILKNHLEDYYTGLLSQNINQRKIPAGKILKPVAAFTKVETQKGDTETYSGTVKMLDYLDVLFETITVNCIIHKKNCGSHTAIIFQVSPKPLDHKVWQQLNKLNESFGCS